jgi:hypothetical protein
VQSWRRPAPKLSNSNPTASDARDSLTLGLIVIALLGVALVSLSQRPTWQQGSLTRAPWCLPDQTPRFELGFAELARHLGDIMGEPTECEHGDVLTADTLQATTTGLAIYRSCTNTPSFTRGREHWMLTAQGLEYRTDGAPQTSQQPLVRVPDLRQPCDA